MKYYKLIADEEHPEGVKVEMTPEEVAEVMEEATHIPTQEERIAALEAAVLELAEVIANG